MPAERDPLARHRFLRARMHPSAFSPSASDAGSIIEDALVRSVCAYLFIVIMCIFIYRDFMRARPFERAAAP